MDLPRFCIIGNRPVKAVPTADGGMSIQAYDWQTGEFVRDTDYLDRVMLPDEEVDVVSEEEFEEHVKALREERGGTAQ